MLLQFTYRSLLRIAKTLDENPVSRSLFFAVPKEIYVRLPTGGKIVELKKSGTVRDTYNDLVFEFNGFSELYKPNSKSQLLTEFIKQKFKTNERFDADLGLCGIRHLETLKDIVSQTSTLTPPKNVSISPLSEEIEAGKILVSHCTGCLSQSTLNRSIVLLTDVGDSSVGGVIINKFILSQSGSPVKVRDVLVDHKAKNDLGPLLDNVVFRGGDVMASSLICLTPIPIDEDTCNAIKEDLFVCNDIVSAASAVSRGEIDAKNVKVLAGHCGWAPKQLVAELDRTVWFLAECGDLVPQNQCIESCSEIWSSTIRGFGKNYDFLTELDTDAVLSHEAGRKLIEDHYSALESALPRFDEDEFPVSGPT